MSNKTTALVLAIWKGEKLVMEERSVDGIPHYEMPTVLLDGKAMDEMERGKEVYAAMYVVTEQLGIRCNPGSFFGIDCVSDRCGVKWVGQDIDNIVVLDLLCSSVVTTKANPAVIEVDPIDVLTNAMYYKVRNGPSPTSMFIHSYAQMRSLTSQLTGKDTGRII